MKQNRPIGKGEFNMCRRKRRYTPRRAYRTLGKVSQNGAAHPPHAYRCPICGEFHLGRTREKQKKNKVYES